MKKNYKKKTLLIEHNISKVKFSYLLLINIKRNLVLLKTKLAFGCFIFLLMGYTTYFCKF